MADDRPGQIRVDIPEDIHDLRRGALVPSGMDEQRRARPSLGAPRRPEHLALVRGQGPRGEQAGLFHEAEGDLVEGVLRLGDRRIGGMMLPRNEIVWLDPADSPEQLRRKITESGHSRFPVADRSLENVLGVVDVKDLLTQSLGSEPVDMRAAMRSPLVVPEHTRVLPVQALFKQTRSHLALVVDEYGMVQGLVTLHDMLEAIAGDLPAADAPMDREPKAVQRTDGSWEVDGALPVGELQEIVPLADIYQIAKNCRTSGEMIEKYYASHIKTSLDAAAINIRKPGHHHHPDKGI